VRSDCAEAQQKCASLTASHEARELAFQEQIAQLNDARTALSAQFSEIGGKLLGEAQKQFLERAEARFKQSEEIAGAGLKALLQPVTDRLQRYEEGVAKVEAERRDAFGNLVGLIESMRIGQEKVSSEAAKLVNSLRNAPKSRGRWGEQQLKNVLETCGLTENCDFQTEVSVEGDDGRLRPDVIIRIPGGRTLIVDAKVSLNAYQDAFGAVDEAERRVGLAAHAAAMRAHVNTLGNKAYQTQFGNSPDYVIMFVPGEHFLSAALAIDPSMFDYAADKKIFLASPTVLLPLLRAVYAGWKAERTEENAKKMHDAGVELFNRFVKVMEHITDVGIALRRTVEKYNGAIGSIDRMLWPKGEEMQRMAGSGKQLGPLDQIEAIPLESSKLRLHTQTDEDADVVPIRSNE